MSNRLASLILILTGSVAAVICFTAAVAMQANTNFAPVQVTLIYTCLVLNGSAAIMALIGYMLSRRLRTNHAWPIRAAMLFAVAFATIAADQATGIFYPPPDRLDSVLQPHPTRGWSYRPFAEGLGFGTSDRINSIGFRDPEIPIIKPIGEYRILFLGDSVAAGFGINMNDTFVRQLEPMLTNNGKRIRTINGACCGYASWQETDVLRNEGLRLSPDLVVLCFCQNDVIGVVDTPKGVVRGKPMSMTYPPLNSISGFARMAAYYRDQRRMEEIKSSHLWTDVPSIKTSDMFSLTPIPLLEKAWTRALADLDECADLCKSHNLPMIVASFPVEFDLPADAAARRIIDRLDTWAKGKGVRRIDLTTAFEREISKSGNKPKAYFVDDIHFNRKGCEVIAANLSRCLLETETAPRSPSREPCCLFPAPRR